MLNPSLKNLETVLGYTFHDKTLLKTALTHRSKSKNNNERFEFLGDALLETIISDRLFRDKTKASEGDLTRLRATLVRGKTLSEIADNLKIKDYMIVGSGELRTGGYQRESTVADAFEAIVAAIYLDSDFVTCQTVITQIFAKKIASLPDAEVLKDAKTKLQEYIQANDIALPVYELLNISGPDHAKIFNVRCIALGQEAIASGSSKKKAEQQAARQILEQVVKIND